MRLSAIMLLATLALAHGGAVRGETYYVETFGSDNAGWSAWTIDGDGALAEAAAVYNATSGNPGGYIQSSVGSDSGSLFMLQAGDASLYHGLAGMMCTDIMIAGQIEAPFPAFVRFVVGKSGDSGENYFVTTDASSWSPAATEGWVSYSAALVEASFQAWGLSNGSYSLAEVIQAPTDVGLLFTGESLGDLGFSSAGGATISIDNFDAVPPVPEPLTVMTAFLAIGSFGAYVRRYTCRPQSIEEVTAAPGNG